ncbi:hypothetical protein ABIF65_005811 [Bradyrhizobium japonicum]|jgi:hypothetical protein|nr:hypothetical protein [Bradyrhizobium japonicum]MCP1782438.1 hypothetical protein [Bradyrhizobium japonicum]MCP1861866.1 hypothetical protein [Bradyrhizobium japonicum]MCP1892622.1 hypothetical protein [Bradyrhizobium japonicum]MCP1965272.1 hypothetical protein [Bradyrhizobium japonicum]
MLDDNRRFLWINPTPGGEGSCWRKADIRPNRTSQKGPIADNITVTRLSDFPASGRNKPNRGRTVYVGANIVLRGQDESFYGGSIVRGMLRI